MKINNFCLTKLYIKCKKQSNMSNMFFLLISGYAVILMKKKSLLVMEHESGLAPKAGTNWVLNISTIISLISW